MNIHNNIRVNSIFFVFLSLYSIIIANLYILQIKQSHFFKNLGQQQSFVTAKTTPPRAAIFDRNGFAIAINKDNLSAFIIPDQLEEPHKIKEFLKKNFESAEKKLSKTSKSHFLYIKRRLTQDQLDLIKSSNLPDIKFLIEPSRYYPIRSLGPVIGITDVDNQGTFGIEKLENAKLSGKPSTYILEKDARTKNYFYFKRETKVAGLSGEAVNLTIDSRLQFMVYEELKETIEKIGAKEGSVLITNPETGEILAMVNYPDFDPNNTEKLDLENTKNRIAIDIAEFGSVIKVFLALAALNEEVVKPDDMIDCENKLETTLNGITFTTYKAKGIINFKDVIQYSNNIGVAKVALKLGKKLYDNYLKLGFTKKIGLFPGEPSGFITPPEKWSNASIISLSFGYEITASLLQLAQAFSIIINNGFVHKLKIIKDQKETEVAKEQLFKTSAIGDLKNILISANTINIPGFTIYGKTGTARLLTNGQYDKTRHRFTYMAAVEKGDYKRQIMVSIKETQEKSAMASTIALPLSERIIQQMLIHDKMI